jgi:RNA polymerase sigma factor (sigma-70 family)
VNESLLRELVPAVIGVLVRRGADFAGAEDAVQDALVEAVRGWPDDPPRDPKGWLVTVAWRKFLDAVRADTSRRHREIRVEGEPMSDPGEAPLYSSTVDDTLLLYFLCAHPSLTPASAVALTLRAVGGLTTRQIAQAYLVPEATMAQRIRRAKRTVSAARFNQPGDISTVLRVLYLVFNEGYSGDVDLAAEAIRLTRQLAAKVNHEEVAGLLALMLLHHARRPARTRPDGRLVPLADQDRSLWNTCLIAEGVDVLQTALTRDRLGEFQAQPPSPRCTPTRGRPRRPTGCRSSSGTTNWCALPTAPWPASTGPSRSGRQTARGLASPPWPSSTPPCRATPPRRTCMNVTVTR